MHETETVAPYFNPKLGTQNSKRPMRQVDKETFYHLVVREAGIKKNLGKGFDYGTSV
jgi:hypothetical protein